MSPEKRTSGLTSAAVCSWKVKTKWNFSNPEGQTVSDVKALLQKIQSKEPHLVCVLISKTLQSFDLIPVTESNENLMLNSCLMSCAAGRWFKETNERKNSCSLTDGEQEVLERQSVNKDSSGQSVWTNLESFFYFLSELRAATHSETL